MEKDFSGKDVVDLYNALEAIGVKIWIDGGWGVDALLGEQMRKHLTSKDMLSRALNIQTIH